MNRRVSVAVALNLALLSSAALAQHDPGPRAGAPGAGGPYLTLDPAELSLFSHAFLRFAKTVSVSGTIEKGKGLGPTFNGNSCAMCHAQPTAGGSSPGLAAPEEPHENPQMDLASLDGATNFLPPFIRANGPILVARFLRKADGSSDGDIHGLFTIAGRADAKGCALKQPDFAAQMARKNVAFRIPTPLYGLGLAENTPDATLRANLAATASARAKLGIGGSFNIGGDGTIARFGWKAHRESLLTFAGEAMNQEEGVTNELFPVERETAPGCVFNASPEDSGSPADLRPPPDTGSARLPKTAAASSAAASSAISFSAMSSDAANFAAFIRLLAPPKPGETTPSTETGAKLFHEVGCDLCHSPTLTTGQSIYSSLSGVTYRPYSDFALHHMGPQLADGITQGKAVGDQFRTAPLWGLGQRLFFLHDGRAADLVQAIRWHASKRQKKTQNRDGGVCSEHEAGKCGSEADGVVRNFKMLAPARAQDLLNFLRSL